MQTVKDVLFLGFCLLAGGLLLNAASQWVSSPKRTSKK